MLVHVKWTVPVLAALGLALGCTESRLARQNQPCSAATLDGTYDWADQGLVKTANIHRSLFNLPPIAAEAGPYTVFDGAGVVTSIIVTHHFSPGNSIVVTRTGTYTVKQNCTGEITWNTSPNKPLSQALAVSPDGHSADFTNRSTEMIVAGTAGTTDRR
jgi:hypothetical protein